MPSRKDATKSHFRQLQVKQILPVEQWLGYEWVRMILSCVSGDRVYLAYVILEVLGVIGENRPEIPDDDLFHQEDVLKPHRFGDEQRVGGVL